MIALVAEVDSSVAAEVNVGKTENMPLQTDAGILADD
jgi:hypothetical protein